MNGAEIDEGMLNRARGCLLGQVAGDNLGGLVEFLGGPEVIARLYPDGVRQMRDGGTWGLMAGQATDDSELALAARALEGDVPVTVLAAIDGALLRTGLAT